MTIPPDPVSDTQVIFRVHHQRLLRKQCRCSEFYWPVFSGIQTEYGEIQSIRTRKTPTTDTFHAMVINGFIAFKKKHHQYLIKIMCGSLLANLVLSRNCGLTKISFHHR